MKTLEVTSVAEKFTVHHTPPVKKHNEQTLANCPCALAFDWLRLILCQPLGGLSFELRVVCVNPGLIHCDDFLQEAWVSVHTSQHCGTAVKTLHEMCWGEQAWHKLGCTTTKLQVLPQDVMDSGMRNLQLGFNGFDSHSFVLLHQLLDSLDVLC